MELGEVKHTDTKRGVKICESLIYGHIKHEQTQ